MKDNNLEEARCILSKGTIVYTDFHLDEMACNFIKIETANFLNTSLQLHTYTIPIRLCILPLKVLNLLFHEIPTYFIQYEKSKTEVYIEEPFNTSPSYSIEPTNPPQL
jgi:hypothetical protein